MTTPATAPEPATSRRLRVAGARGTQALLAVLILTGIGSLAVHAAPESSGSAPPTPTFRPIFPVARRLLTNEVAYFDPKTGAPVDENWIVTSGSLFADAGDGWTGPIDAGTPDPKSAVHTNSAIFRLVTRRHDFQNVSVRFDLDVAGLTSTTKTPPQTYDGVHVFLRYSSPQQLYAASVFRRDGEIAIKKKVPGGPVNGGDYATLATVHHPVAMRRWNTVIVTAVNVQGGVRLSITINGSLVLTTVDHGALGAPLTGQGRIGIRGDNSSFRFRAFTASGL